MSCCKTGWVGRGGGGTFFGLITAFHPGKVAMVSVLFALRFETRITQRPEKLHFVIVPFHKQSNFFCSS